MSVIRAFIAIEMSSEIQNGLDELSTFLKGQLQGVPVRWVPVKNIHLTLKFLGNVSPANIEVMKKILQGEATRHEMFEISVGELGAFPSIRRPRVAWVKVQAPAELDLLQRGIEDETARLGYSREERTYKPHLTLGRVSRNANAEHVCRFSEVLESHKVGYIGAMCVRSIHLYRSDLKPTGAEYTLLNKAPLGAENREA
jgi:2'-5' RNA ligase